MSMQDPRKYLSNNERLSRWMKPKVAIPGLLGIAAALAGIAVISFSIFDETVAADSSQLWISSHSDMTSALVGYGVAAAVGLVVGLGIRLAGRFRLRYGREQGATNQKKTAWRYREMSRREKQRLALAFAVSSSFAGGPLVLFGLAGEGGGIRDAIVWMFIVAGALGVLVGLVVALIQVRPSRTVMQIAEDRLIAERKQYAHELAQLRESDAQQMEQWKNKREQELLQQIVDLVNSGAITCFKCAGIDEAHYSGHNEE
jgi:hypothetical protein